MADMSRTAIAAELSATADGEATAPGIWRDPKRYAWLLGLIIPLLPLGAWFLSTRTGLGLFWYLGPLVVFGVIPIIDLAFGIDERNPPESMLYRLERDRYYRYCTYAYLPLQYASLVLACWCWGRGALSLGASIGLALTVGCVGGIAINTAHELGHKRERLERWLSKIALAQTGYGHFYVEHNRGHHVRVATPEDPASSRFGESFYAFWPRTVLGSLESSLEIERTRLERTGSSFWTWNNDILSAWAMTIALYSALLGCFGSRILPYLLLQAVVGFSLLEVVNYLEHYGLVRQRGRDGRYERCLPAHSWNSNRMVSNVFLYHLQRHSDHHAHPTRRYQALRTFDEAPNLPSGYATMILFALVPPLWRRVMDPRVLSHYGGDRSRVNLGPHRGEGLDDGAAQAATEDGGAGANAWPGACSGARPWRRFRCPGCAYVYDERRGNAREGFPGGTRWSAIPALWHCPECGVRDKVDFAPIDE
jgi:alkane 1-monooxygenase